MKVCVPVTPEGQVAPGFGRAPRVGLADVEDGRLVGWQVVDVAWDALHETDTEGGHHARIARFVREQGVEVVVAQHMGEGMVHMLGRLGIELRLGAAGDARQAVLAATAGVRRPLVQ